MILYNFLKKYFFNFLFNGLIIFNGSIVSMSLESINEVDSSNASYVSSLTDKCADYIIENQINTDELNQDLKGYLKKYRNIKIINMVDMPQGLKDLFLMISSYCSNESMLKAIRFLERLDSNFSKDAVAFIKDILSTLTPETLSIDPYAIMILHINLFFGKNLFIYEINEIKDIYLRKIKSNQDDIKARYIMCKVYKIEENLESCKSLVLDMPEQNNILYHVIKFNELGQVSSNEIQELLNLNSWEILRFLFDDVVLYIDVIKELNKEELQNIIQSYERSLNQIDSEFYCTINSLRLAILYYGLNNKEKANSIIDNALKYSYKKQWYPIFYIVNCLLIEDIYDSKNLDPEIFSYIVSKVSNVYLIHMSLFTKDNSTI